MTTAICYHNINAPFPRHSDLILLLEDQTPNDENQFGKLKTFYRSCLDTETIRQKGFQPAIDFIQETFGPYLNPEETDSGDLTDVIYGMKL